MNRSYSLDQSNLADLDESKVRLPRWRRLIWIGIVVLVALCAWLIFETVRLVSTQVKLSASATALERQEKLARKGRAAAELAHELHAPLRAINARLYEVEDALSNEATEHKNASLIRREIRRLNGILEEFQQLDHAPEPNPLPISSAKLLQDVSELLSPQLAQNAIQLKVDSVEDASFRADPHQLEQVLINLIQNAAESIVHNGTVTLRASRLSAVLHGKSAEAVTIEVQDNGPGIPDEIKNRLYDPFFTTKKTGVGLGLSIAERIIDRHGGTLDFDTEINHGTTFRIVLPLEPP